jgi:Na+-transporting NADH:ubiquinone oxidoreductase subunit C
MKDKILMIVFVLVLGTILTTALVAVNSYTAPIIERNASIEMKSNILSALKISYEENEVEEVFEKSVAMETAGDETYYRSSDGTIAFPYEGSGLWGPITGVLAVTPDLTKITGITIMYQEETPGLGSRIAEAEYLDTYVGKVFKPVLTILPPGKGVEEDQVDSISGATMSSKAFVEILNTQYGKYRTAIRGE